LISDVAVAALVIVAFWGPSLVARGEPMLWTVGGALAGVVASSIIFRWRYAALAPIAALAASGLGWVFQVSSDPMLAVAWTLYPLALTRKSWTRAVGSTAVLLMLLLSLTAGAPPSPAGFEYHMVISAAAIGASWLLGQAEANRLEAQHQAVLRAAESELVLEQTAMAREVHDVVGHALSVISAEADVSRHLPDVGEAELRDSLADIEQRARGALEEVQALVRALRDGVRVHDVPTSLEQVVNAARVSGLEVSARVESLTVPDEIHVIVTRVMQEALSNTLRHARATSCEIAVWHERHGAVRLHVEDDGVGISDQSRPGTGLIGMRERVEEVGGSMTISNGVAGGVLLAVSIPVRIGV
jgi:signal transduction histidine kinase